MNYISNVYEVIGEVTEKQFFFTDATDVIFNICSAFLK